ncbi:MAG TPA: serine/threonine-protein kinase [Streptosporangiaceae bacterium]|nr:serine/threonine-protein kinase [Streptosporangiaceae bacterium]
MSEGNTVVPSGFAPGARIAGYLLEEQIGQGGMAVVFRAHDERLDRTVALKILAPALAADEAFRQRFIRESRAAAAVDDPHIIPVFEAGEASGVLFIAMRFVRGGDVRSLVGQFGPMPPGRVAEIVSQVASALDAAHGRGLVHRDVKPANMLLDASSGAGRPDHIYLSDFGLSKGSLQTSGLTGTGTFLGTLDYISPEQIEGKPVDGRADEYALACAAFELLTGAPPFQREEAMAVMYAQLSEQPPALSSKRRDLGYAADAVFARALAKAPADRYGSCREFSDALREAFGIRPYDSGPTHTPSGEHPATQVVRPSGPGEAAATAAAAGAFAGQGPASGHAPGAGQPGGYPGQGGQSAYPGRPSQPSQPTQQGQRAYQGQGGYQGQQQSYPGQGGYQGQGGDQGQGGYGAAETQLAGGGTRTEPDLAAQQGGGYGQYGAGQYGAGQYGGQPVPQASLARPWWKSPLALLAAIAVLIGGGAAAYALTAGGGGGNGGTGGNNGGGHHAVTLQPPGCSTATASGKQLPAQPLVSVPNGGGNPFGIAASADGKAVFVVTDTSVEVLKVASDGSLTHGWDYQIAGATTQRAATTALVTPNGKYLLVAVDNGIAVLNAQAAAMGAPSANLGFMAVPGLTKYGRAVGLAVTPDNKFAFVALQFADQVGVFDLASAVKTGAYSSAYVGSLNAGTQPVGLAVSPDGTTLYATNFVQDSPVVPGQLTLFDVSKAATKGQQKTAQISHVKAGCNPARIVVSTDGKTVWVTTRQSNEVLGYSASQLRTDPAKALHARVRVGQTPIGIASVKDGSRLVISDNDGSHTGSPSLAVLDPNAALNGKPALVGYIKSGVSPHEVTLSADGQFLYVACRESAQVQVVNLSKVP